MPLTPDPFANGLRHYADQLRNRAVTAEATVQALLTRIDTLNPSLDAFEYVDRDGALTSARALDDLLKNGTDLGPLMGVPIAVKDIITVSGMPTTNGSNADTSALNGGEGHLIRQFRQAGCIIIGKTRTVEFALGATGVNEARGTPKNPWDLNEHRLPGGSSSGSAVAVAAALCAFALGTDTGGSIRIPACYTGLFGHKTTKGRWPTDGIFPLSPSLDSPGPLCRNADDAAIIHEVICGEQVTAQSLQGRRFGVPGPIFLDELDDQVAEAFALARERLVAAGVTLIDINVPEALERESLFPAIVAPELVARLTPQRFQQIAGGMDTVTRSRAEMAFEISGVEHAAALQRYQQLKDQIGQYFTDLDGWISPTCPALPVTLASLQEPALAERALLSSRNTQPINLFGLCAVNLPLTSLPGRTTSTLPTGLQLVCPAGEDRKLLELAAAMEAELGAGSRLNLDRD